MMKWLFGSKQEQDTPEQKQALMPAMVLQGMALPSGMKRDYAAFSREGYVRNVIAFACINKIARACASVDLRVCSDKRDGGIDIKQQDHPLNKLLYRPNPTCGGASFFEALIAFRLIAGNAYVVRNPQISVSNKPPSELWLLAPDRVKVIGGQRGIPAGYEYSPQGGQRVTYAVDAITGRSDVLQMSSFNPLDGWYGLSPMEAAAYSIDTMNAALKWNMALLGNCGRPSGGFKVIGADGKPTELSEEQFARMREAIEKSYSGAENAGRPLLLEGGLEWQEMGLSPKDMDFSESTLMSARFIASAFGVPPQLVNIPGESTYSNYQEAKEAFWQDTVLPMLDNTLDELNHWLAPQYGDEVYIGYDADNIPALEAKRASRFDRIEKSSIMTVNEKRAALGMNSIEGGDVLLVPTGQVPIELLGDETLLP